MTMANGVKVLSMSIFFATNRYGDTVLGIFDHLGHIGNFSVGEKSPVWRYLQLQKVLEKREK
jgi:hypothetical protein